MNQYAIPIFTEELDFNFLQDFALHLFNGTMVKSAGAWAGAGDAFLPAPANKGCSRGLGLHTLVQDDKLFAFKTTSIHIMYKCRHHDKPV